MHRSYPAYQLQSHIIQEISIFFSYMPFLLFCFVIYELLLQLKPSRTCQENAFCLTNCMQHIQ